MNDLTAIEQRILGCLLEKQRTTPDTYPLTLNALRLACNQSTNRDPVVDYGESEIQDALQLLHRRELTRVASGHGSRSSKYRHLVDETLAVDEFERALICVLLLRGEQTPGELKQRTERLADFADLASVDQTLDALVERGLVQRLERRPGEKQLRYRHLLGDTSAGGAPSLASVAPPEEDQEHLPQIDRSAIDRITAPTNNGFAAEIDDLRAAVESLSKEVARLRDRVDQRDDDQV
ncbi:MAG: YceH family protein [Solirubrobacterales bacterium]